MILWTDEQDLLLVQTAPKIGEWRNGVFQPAQTKRSRGTFIHELLVAIFERKQA